MLQNRKRQRQTTKKDQLYWRVFCTTKSQNLTLLPLALLSPTPLSAQSLVTLSRSTLTRGQAPLSRPSFDSSYRTYNTHIYRLIQIHVESHFKTVWRAENTADLKKHCSINKMFGGSASEWCSGSDSLSVKGVFVLYLFPDSHRIKATLFYVNVFCCL